MFECLSQIKNEGYNLEFTVPAGGMALWVNVGKKAEEISLLAREKDIFLLAENSFHLDENNNKDEYIRLGFAGQGEDKIKQGLLLLKPLLNR